MDSESLLGCLLEDQCQPLQAWPHILWELPAQYRACTSIGWIYMPTPFLALLQVAEGSRLEVGTGDL